MSASRRRGPAPNMSKTAVDRAIRQAKIEATNEATALALVLMMTVLLDKYGAEEYIADIYRDWNKLAEEVKEGRVKLHELRDVLRKEYGIRI